MKYTLYARPFESTEHEKAWLIRVTVNAGKDLIKSFFRSRTIPLEDLGEYAPDITSEQYAVMESVRALPKQYRDVIYLHYYEGYTAPEIAGILKQNPNTVYTHLHKGKELLKKVWEVKWMDNRIKEAFDTIRAPERMKRKTKAVLRKKTFDYGRNLVRMKICRRRIAAGLLMLCVVLTGSGLWFFPTTSIGVDVNLSIELKVNGGIEQFP